MAPIANSISELIGNTPVLSLSKLSEPDGAEILGKIEYFNPGGSIKDRIALGMIETAERDGLLKPGSTIVEATSGNTGIGLAMIAAARGYRMILVMPDTMSAERQIILKAYGAEILLTPGDNGMDGSINLARSLVNEKGYFMPSQFENPANPQIHRETTAIEIIEQTNGQLDAFVAGVGTGGTITGVGEVLKKKIPHIKIIAIEPKESAVLSGGCSGPHKLQGIGAGFIPPILNRDVIDQIITVSDDDAYLTTLRLAKEEGLMVGITSGAAVYGALEVAKQLGPGKRVMVILPDTGERYLSLLPYFKLDLRKRGIKS